MDKMDIKNGLFNCNVCNKDYKSYKSLWNHNKKFHNKNKVIIGNNEVIIGNNEVIIGKNQCKYCNKILNDRSYKYKHQKICKYKE